MEDLDEGWKMTRLKMKDVEDKVRLLQNRMNKLREKYSTLEPVKVYINSCDDIKQSETKDKNKSQVSSLHDVEVKNRGIKPKLPETNDKNESKVSSVSNVTLLCMEDEQVPAHRLILSTCSPLKKTPLRKIIEKEFTNGPDYTNVTLVCDEIKNIFVHNELISRSSTNFEDNPIKEVQEEHVLSKNLFNNQFFKVWIRKENLLFMNRENCQHKEVFPVKGPDKKFRTAREKNFPSSYKPPPPRGIWSIIELLINILENRACLTLLPTKPWWH